MSQEAADRFAVWEIQHINKIVPTGIHIQGMLVGVKGRRMMTVILVDASQFKGAVAESSDSSLKSENSASGRKAAIIE
jgi:hypothetical protein